MRSIIDQTRRWARWSAIGGALALAFPLRVAAEPDTSQKAKQPPPAPIRIKDTREQNQKLEVTHSSFSHSLFENCRAEAVTFRDVAMPGLLFENANLERIRFDNVNLSQGKIQNANLSDLQIKGAQLGGALFRHIGLPPPDDPAHQAGAEQRPLRFEECDLHGSTVKDSDLSGVAISGCKMRGMTIDGISVEDLLAAYREEHGERKAASEQRGSGK